MKDISARELKGHNILAVERFWDDTRWMIEFSSCGVYNEKAIAAAQSAIETGENLSISNPDK